jgi:hypothetical protein
MLATKRKNDHSKCVITGVYFKNFRGFDDLCLNPMRRITLIAGQNDTGKTSVLEGIYLAALKTGMGPNELPRLFRAQPGKQQNNTDEFEGYWSWLFRNHDPAKIVEIQLTDERKNRLDMEIRPENEGARMARIKFFQFEQLAGTVEPLQRSGPPLLVINSSGQPAFTSQGSRKTPNVGVLGIQSGDPTEVAELFNSAVQERDAEAKIEALMRELEPRIKRLRYSKPKGTFHPLVYCDIGLERALPSTQMGEGFNRALAIFCQIFVSKLNVLLVDEIENGLHHSVLPAVWRGLFQVAESEDVQLVATTHSWECVRAAYEIAKDKNPEGFQYLRLDRVAETVKCTAVETDTMALAVAEGWEMR